MQFEAPNLDAPCGDTHMHATDDWIAYRRDLHIHKAKVEWTVHAVDLHALLWQISSLRVVVSTVGWVVQAVGHEEHQLTTGCCAAVVHRVTVRL